MVSRIDLTLSLLNILFQAFVIYFFIARGLFRKFLFFNLYFLLSISIAIAQYAALFRFGLNSAAYISSYHFTDAALMIFLFLAICELGVRLAGSKMPAANTRLVAAAALVATAWLSFSSATTSSTPVAPFVVQLSRNLFLLCCLCVVLLWGWTLNHKLNGPAARFLTVLDIYLALSLIPYAAHNQVSPLHLENLSPIITASLPLGCCFALVRRDNVDA
jgi:hypothetical protein